MLNKWTMWPINRRKRTYFQADTAFFKDCSTISPFICRMSQASPYTIAKELILAGKLKSLDELVLIIKKTTLAQDMKVGPKRLNGLLDNPGLFTIQDIHKIAALIGVPAKPLLDVISAEFAARKKK